MPTPRPRLPPGPTSAFVAMIRYLRSPILGIGELARRYGDPMSFPTFDGPIVVTGDPEGIKAIFTADADNFVPFALESLGALLGPGSLLMMSGAPHKAARKLLTPSFHGSRMRAYGRLMRDITLERIGTWQPGKVFALMETTQAISLDVIIRAVFGVTSPERVGQFHQSIVETVAALKPSFVLLKFLRREFGGLGAWAAYQRRRRDNTALLAEELAAHRARPEPGEDILSMLLQARYDDGSAMPDQQIFEQLMTLVVAGHETTAISLAWAAYWLHRNPQTLERLLAEIGALGPDPDPEKVSQLPYLDAVCQETLRLNPIVPFVSRRLARPFTLKGFELEAGTGVGANLTALHYREDLYPEPLSFHPERFLERSFTPFEYAPFGGGARRCLGAAFAMYEMKIVLATLLSQCRLQLAGEAEVKPEVRAATVGPKGGVKMVLMERRGVEAAAYRGVGT